MKIGDKVKIIELNISGRILSIFQNHHGIQYNVRYFWNGDAKTVCFLPDEIKLIQEVGK